MGPLRRHLTAAPALLLPGPAVAEVCEKIRPDWSATTGARGVLAETAYVLASLPALGCLSLLLLALIFPRLWLAIPASLLTLAFAALLLISRQSDLAALAQTDGCLASATPAALLLALAAILALARALHARRR